MGTTGHKAHWLFLRAENDEVSSIASVSVVAVGRQSGQLSSPGLHRFAVLRCLYESAS